MKKIEISKPTKKPELAVEIPLLPVVADKATSDFDKDVMFRLYRSGTTLKDIALQFDLSEKTIQRYKATGGWEERKLEEALVMKAGPSEASVEAYSKLVRVCWKLANDLEKATLDGDDARTTTANLKTIVDCVDKLTRLHLFAEAGGIDQKNVTTTVVKVDYAEMAKLYSKLKAEGIEYNAKEHLKDVIDAQYKNNAPKGSKKFTKPKKK